MQKFQISVPLRIFVLLNPTDVELLFIQSPSTGRVLRWGFQCPQPNPAVHSDCEPAVRMYHFFTHPPLIHASYVHNVSLAC